MPDLGAYATWVLASYAVAVGLLSLLTVASVWQARRTRAALQRMEETRRATRTAPGDAAPQREAADG